jgi:hypothetical protein
MKIIAQSTVADGSPYIHLGYLSVTPNNPPMAGFAGVLIIVGIAMAFSVGTGLKLIRRKSIGLVLGGYAVIIVGCMGLLGSYSGPRHHLMSAREIQAGVNMRGLAMATFIYAAQWSDFLPPRLGDLIPERAKAQILKDPRVAAVSITGPEATMPAAGDDAHCDFYYAGAGVRLHDVPKPDAFILLYDHPDAGLNRIMALADGHIEMVRGGSAELARLVADSNKQRKALKLPPLPAGLAGPPPAVP